MKNRQMTTFIHNYLKENINKTDILVDATIGNGYDTLLLAQLSKFVYGFDIQEQAINNTNELLSINQLSNYKLILDSFENILTYIKDFKGVVFNLGYLPGTNKDITTTKETTIKTLKLLTSHLKKDMFIVITCYPGHSEGEKEALAITNLVSLLDSKFRVYQYKVINELKRKPPFIIIIEKQ